MKFTIKLKLGLAFALLIILLLGTAAYAVVSLAELNNSVVAMTKGPVTRLELVQNINLAQLQSIRQQKNMVGADTPAEIQAARSKGDEARAELKEALDGALAISTEEGRPRWLKIQALAADADAADDRIRALMQSGAADQA